MGPTNIALVRLFQADQELRTAQERLDSASRSVRLQERRVGELTEKVKLNQTKLRELQSKAAQLELDVRTRDEKIEKLRTQQQNSKNHKEYQAFLTEINTEKIDKAKQEEEALKVMESVEKSQAELKDLTAQLEGEQKKHDETRQQLGGRLAELQTEVDKLRPAREEAAAAVPPKGLQMFERLAEKNDGEAMSAIAKPDRRREEYLCTACSMSLVADIYNRLHSRDDIVTCPSCHRMLYIPADLPPEAAVNKPKVRREPKPDNRVMGAPIGRQMSAVDVARSINQEEDETPAESEGDASAAPTAESSQPQE